MPTYPKLRVTHRIDGQPGRMLLDFEQAPSFLFNYDVIVTVEGEVVHSYGQLLEIASREDLRNREFLEVQLETVIAGG
jgi:hypothetical protein